MKRFLTVIFSIIQFLFHGEIRNLFKNDDFFRATYVSAVCKTHTGGDVNSSICTHIIDNEPIPSAIAHTYASLLPIQHLLVTRAQHRAITIPLQVVIISNHNI